MASVIDLLTKFAFTVEQLSSVKELVYEGIITSPELSLFTTIFPGIMYDKEIGFVGGGGMLGVAGQGCNPTAQAWSIATRKVTWAPKSWEVYVAQCWTDLEATIAVFSLKSGVSRPDFSESDYMNIVIDFLIQGIKDMMMRLAFFGDTAAKNIADGGTLTAGVSKLHFNWMDGFFKQMVTQYTIDSNQHVTISENAGASYALQALPSTNIQSYLQSLISQADPELMQMQGNVIICTRSFYNAYKLSLQGLGIPETYMNLTTGKNELMYDGYPIYPVDTWDSIIRANYDNGTKWVNPHRAIFTNPSVLAIGVDDEGSFRNTEVWYNKDTRQVKFQAMGQMDAKLANPKLFVYAV